MVKQFVFCVLLFIAMVETKRYRAMVFVGPIPERFKGQEGCYIEELDRVVPFGENAYSNISCVEYACNKVIFSVYGCGRVYARNSCEIATDNSKPFPKCCPKIVCPE